MAKQPKQSYTAQDIRTLLYNKYLSHNKGTFQEYVVLEEVPNATGWEKSRAVDMAVFHMWRTGEGHNRSAIEIKVSRADFMNELQNPEKHQWCREYFNEFWFAAPRDLVKVDELPVGVGLMAPRGKTMTVLKQAARNPHPKLDNATLLAFMRAASHQIEREREGNRDTIVLNDRRYVRARKYYDAVETFIHKRTGDINIWPDDSVADIVSKLEQASLDKQALDDLQFLHRTTEQFQKDITRMAEAFLLLASESLLAKDDFGKRVHNYFGFMDPEKAIGLAQERKTTRSHQNLEKFVQLLRDWRQE